MYTCVVSTQICTFGRERVIIALLLRASVQVRGTSGSEQEMIVVENIRSSAVRGAGVLVLAGFNDQSEASMLSKGASIMSK